MSKELVGDVCAYMPAREAGGKARYPRIGIAFKDDRGQISLKIDTLPLPGTGWDGWVNIFPRTEKSQSADADFRSNSDVKERQAENEAHNSRKGKPF